MKEHIYPKDGPPAVGPYTPAIKTQGLIFVSGQIPIEPTTGKLLRGNIEEQTRRVLENVKILLEAAGSSMDKVVKAGVFLEDLANFEAMNKVYAEYFGEAKPARSTVEVARLPKDVAIEIEVIALA